MVGGRDTEPTGTGPPDVSAALGRIGGEFRARAVEALFEADRAMENHRHARILLIASAILNTLFFASDWRFRGTPHFWVAIPARAAVVAVALLGLALLRRGATPPARERVMTGWMALNAVAVAALVSSHSDIALFVAILLPIIYYLAVPTRFAWTLSGGGGCSLLMLIGYDWTVEDGSTVVGLVLAMLVLNVAMALVLSRWNRLQRLAWLATRAERRSGRELAASRAQLEKIFAASPVPMLVTARSDGSIVKVNDSAIEFFGAVPGAVGASSVSGYYADPDDRERLIALIDRDGGARDFETRVRRADGSMRTVLITANAIDLAQGRTILSGIVDISDRKAIEENLECLASTDALTGLPNRLSFFASGRTEMMRAARFGAPLGLLMVDLDHFKQINDSFGHLAGDTALRGFAVTCRSVLGEHGIAARIGGEEFGILLRNTSLDGALGTAEALRGAVESMSIDFKHRVVRLTTSIGVTLVDPRERDLDPALARADAALYAAKHGGRNRVIAAAAPSFCRTG